MYHLSLAVETDEMFNCLTVPEQMHIPDSFCLRRNLSLIRLLLFTLWGKWNVLFKWKTSTCLSNKHSHNQRANMPFFNHTIPNKTINRKTPEFRMLNTLFCLPLFSLPSFSVYSWHYFQTTVKGDWNIRHSVGWAFSMSWVSFVFICLPAAFLTLPNCVNSMCASFFFFFNTDVTQR